MNQSQQKKRPLSQSDILPLHQNEVDLIVMIRSKYRFGRVEIDCRDGLPVDILKTVERTRLGTGVYPQTK